MSSPGRTTTNPSTQSRWMAPGILASTATDRTKAALKASKSTTTASPSTPGDPFVGVWKWASNRRRHRFPKGVDGRPELRPAQRLELLRPAAAEEQEEAEECLDYTADEKSTAEGRRLYLGNLAYSAQPEEIETFVCGRLAGEDGTSSSAVAGPGAGVGPGGYVGMHISVDEFTGRNPTYCFLEFEDADSASRATELLGGEMLLGRTTKCSPCQLRGGTLAGRRPDESGAAFRRWGDYLSDGGHGLGGGAGAGAGVSVGGGREGPQGPNQTLAYYQSRGECVMRRLYVGGLPRMHDQAMAYHEMVQFFDDFKV